MHKNKLSGAIKSMRAYVAVFFYVFNVFSSSSLADVVESLPVLKKAIADIRFLYRGKELSFLAEKEYQVKKYYYEIQSKTQKLEILKEVKEHFEKAVAKSEENSMLVRKMSANLT